MQNYNALLVMTRQKVENKKKKNKEKMNLASIQWTHISIYLIDFFKVIQVSQPVWVTELILSLKISKIQRKRDGILK